MLGMTVPSTGPVPSTGSSPQWYPVLLDLRGRDCLVVGGGSVGARKAEGLLAGGAHVTLVSREIGAEVQRLSGADRLNVVTRAYESSDLDGMWLVVTAVDDRIVTARISADAASRRVWMNAADDPPNCSVILPAVHRDREVIVSVSTAGASPATARWLRDRFAGELGDLPGRLTDEVKSVRDRVRLHRTSEGLPWASLVDRLASALEGEASQGVNRLTPGQPAARREFGDRATRTANAWLRMNCIPAACATCRDDCRAILPFADEGSDPG